MPVNYVVNNDADHGGYENCGLDATTLESIKAAAKDMDRRLNLRRRVGAAVVDSSHDAKLVLPLWNATCAIESALDLQFKPFDEIGPALAWLDIPETTGRSIVASTERQSR